MFLLVSILSGVFQRALYSLKTFERGKKEERAMLLEEWLNMENNFAELGDVSLVRPQLPRKLRRRRLIVKEDGTAGYVKKCCILVNRFAC